MKMEMDKLTRGISLLVTTFLLGMTSVYVVEARTAPPPSNVTTMGEKEVEVDHILRKFILEADAHHTVLNYSMSTVTIVPDMDRYVHGDLSLAQPLAYCTPGSNEIKINDVYWDSMNDMAKEIVLFHELGHCMLQREHREAVDVHGRKLSIMSSRKRLVKNETYLKWRNEYLDELFDPQFRGDMNR